MPFKNFDYHRLLPSAVALEGFVVRSAGRFGNIYQVLVFRDTIEGGHSERRWRPGLDHLMMMRLSGKIILHSPQDMGVEESGLGEAC